MATFKYFKVTGATTEDDIKRQYRELSVIHHPDRGGSTQEQAIVNQEYQIAMAMIPQFKALGKIDSSGKQFLYDLIDGVAHLLEEKKKYPKWAIKLGVENVRNLVKSIDADSWATFLIGVINKHKK